MRITFIISLLLFFSCQSEPEIKGVEKTGLPKEGAWRMTFDLGDEELPINFTLTHKSADEFDVVFVNANEKTNAGDIEVTDDSITIKLPIYSTRFVLAKNAPDYMSGYFTDLGRKEPYKIPVSANFGPSYRFTENPSTSTILKDRWAVTFDQNDSNNKWNAVGVFDQKKNGEVFGTFLTETGDYRFLEGDIKDNKLRLSCFDGAHLFLFTANLKGDSIVGGKFHSGAHYQTTWHAAYNKNVALRNPNEITAVINEKKWQDVQVSNMKNKTVSLGEIADKEKVKIIQLLGSWCPNCMDETKYFIALNNDFPDALQIIPVGYEKEGVGIESLERMKRDMDIPYDLYLGGIVSKKVASEMFSMLNEVISFPTSIVIDKKGEIRRVHTGFYGPGTGDVYHAYTKEMHGFISSLIEE